MTQPVTRRTVLATSGIAMGALAGCFQAPGGTAAESPTPPDDHQDEHTDDHALEGPSEHATVRMVTTEHGTHFEPHVVWVATGGMVTWINESGQHTATAYHPDNADHHLRMPHDAAPFASGLKTAAGAEFEHTFDIEGVYDYYCAPHETMGMIGSVIVGRPDPHDQPGLAAPHEDMHQTVRSKIGDLNHMVDDALGHHHDEATATPTEHHDEEATEHGH